MTMMESTKDNTLLNNGKMKTNQPTKDASSRGPCPYLDTITRTLLDFDFEPSCSVSLSASPHVYCCLVCSTFFRGKGPQTPAYLHSVNTGHAVYIHLEKGTFHCLPDDYEIKLEDEPSLRDIRDALKPVFSEEEIRALDNGEEGEKNGQGSNNGVEKSDSSNAYLSRDLFGRRYLPGFVGLNNLNKTDFINATLQALAHVKPLRDFFLRCGDDKPFTITVPNRMSSNSIGASAVSKKKRKRGAVPDQPSSSSFGASTTTLTIDPNQFSHLAKTFGTVLRKLWSNKRFKSTVDPHMFVQAVSTASKKRFTIGKQAEAGEFMAWLLHQLHIGTGGKMSKIKKGSRKKGKNKKGSGDSVTSIIEHVFQGVVEITTRQRKQDGNVNEKRKQNDEDEDDRIGSEDEEEVRKREQQEEQKRNLATVEESVIEEIQTQTNFLQLTLDIPEKPLFKDDNHGGLVIPQEPLVNVLKKFNGMSFHDALGRGNVPQKRRYRLKELPNYLILHLSRFQKNGFYKEKNPTIVPFPVKNLDLSNYLYKGDDENFLRKKLPTEAEVEKMSIKELKDVLQTYNHENLGENILEKSELISVVKNFLTTSLPDLLSSKYDLVANITHNIPAEVGREGQRDPLEEGSYRCHVQHKGSGQWYEMQDLHVSEIMAQQIGLSESYLLIFEKKQKL